jgi:hypothetical protein
MYCDAVWLYSYLHIPHYRGRRNLDSGTNEVHKTKEIQSRWTNEKLDSFKRRPEFERLQVLYTITYVKYAYMYLSLTRYSNSH